MQQLTVVSKLTGVSSDVQTSEINLNAPSIIKLAVSRDEISKLARVNQDLVITLHSGETIVLKNFYVTNDQGASQLVLQEDNGTLWWVQDTDGAFHFQPIDDLTPLMSGESSHEGGAVWPWLLGGAAVAGGVAIAASSGGGGGSSHHDDPGNGNPDGGNGGEDPGNGNPGGGDGGTDDGSDPGNGSPGEGGSDDGNGTTPPSAPEITGITDNTGSITGTVPASGVTDDATPTLSGRGTAGNIISVYGSNGVLLGKTEVASNGTWSFTPNTPLGEGEHNLTITQTDADGNVSSATTVPPFTVDTTPPSAVTNPTVNSEGTIVSGTTEPGNTVVIVDSNGDTVGSGIANSDGKFNIPITPPQTNGEILTIIATDPAGNIGTPTGVTAPDTTAPDAPENVVVSENGTSVSGNAEAGSIVTVKDSNGNTLGEAIANGNGNFTITITPAQTNGETLTATATDNAGNTSAGSNVIAPDTTAPAAPENVLVAENGTSVSGTAEPGSTVTITDSSGNKLGDAQADGDGNFTVPLFPNQTTGDTLTAVATDPAGNNSPGTSATAPTIVDTTAPAAPENVLVAVDGTSVSGTAEPGSTVHIKDSEGNDLGEAMADINGNFTVALTPALTDGETVEASATDSSGNTGPGTTATAPDLTAPPAPVITQITDDVAGNIGAISNGGLTNDDKPQINGTAAAGSLVKIYDNGTLLTTVTADGDGNWSWTPTAALAQGSHTLSFTASDASNNTSGSTTWSLFVDSVAPTAPTITLVNDDVGSITGNVANNNGITDDTRPTISGTGEPGSLVSLYDNGILLTTVLIGTSGSWSYTVAANQAFTPGEHQLTVTSLDAAGNSTAQPAVITINVDTSKPDAPTIATATDDVGSIQGNLLTESRSDDNLPELNGTGPEGTSITLYDGDIPIATFAVPAGGNWSYQLTQPLSEGSHTLTAIATNAAGTASNAGTFILTIDTTPPPAPVILAAEGLVGDTSLPLNNGGSTKSTLPELTGSGEPGATITVYDNDREIGTAVVQTDGTWSFTPPEALDEGQHIFTTTATDVAGNTGILSPGFTLNIDNTPPTQPGAPIISDNRDPVTGVVTNGNTNDTTPTFSGTGTAGDVISVYLDDNTTPLGTAIVDTDGNWSFTPETDLPEGSYQITITATDPAGNISEPSTAISLNIDLTPPAAPTIETVNDNAGTYTGNLANGAITDDNTPTINGRGIDGTTITLYNGTTVIGTATVTDGQWSITPTTPLTDGSYTLTAKATDAAGNPSGDSNSVSFSVNTTPLLVTDIEDDVAVITGPLTNGGLTNDTSPTVSGSGIPGSTIAIYNNNGPDPVATVTVGENGTWSVDVPLTNGVNALTFIAQDSNGNAISSATPVTLNLDTTPPDAPEVTFVADDGTRISGVAEAGSTVIIYSGDTVLGSAVANATTGEYSVTISPAQTSGADLTAIAQDAAGNQGPGTPFTASNSGLPLPPTLEVVDDVAPVLGVTGNGSATNDTLPLLRGTAEAGAVVTIYQNGDELTTVTADGSGNWSHQLTEPLSEGGTYNFTASQLTSDGSSGQSPNYAITIDTVAPVAPTITSITDDVSPDIGTVADGEATNDPLPTLNGTAEANAIITIYDNGVEIGTTSADGSGIWRFTPQTTPGEGDHTFTVRASDGAGNLSAPSAQYTITITTALPDAPLINSVTDNVGGEQVLTSGQITNDNTPTLEGTTDANALVTIHDNGAVIGTTTADENGNWNYTPTTPLGEGFHALTATVTDAAGNVSNPTSAFELVVDTLPPAIPVITTVIDDQPGSSQLSNGQLTNDTQPTLNGTAEANATITIFDNGTEIGTTNADDDGNWSFTPDEALDQGEHRFTVAATDSAGNTGGESTPFTIKLDSVAPLAPTLVTVQDHTTPVTGTIANGQTTNETRPAFSGTGEVGATITVLSDGVAIGTTIVNAQGNWSLTPQTPLGEGFHTLTVTATDSAGNTSPASPDFTLTVDTVLPAVPTLSSVVDDVAGGVFNGPLANGQATNDARPELSGSAEANATINIYDNGTLITSVTADENGNWTYTPAEDLTQGSHAFAISATDAAGNTSGKSLETTIVVDTTPPPSPTAQISADGSTINGIAEAGSTVTITLPGGTTVTATANNNGVYSVTLPVRQIDGELLSVSATDAAGNNSPAISVTAPIVPLLAEDNVINLALQTNASITNEHHSDYGFLLVNALGTVADVLGTDTAAVNFSIDEGGSGAITINAAATGVVLSLLSTMEIVIQRFDTELNAWVTIVDTAKPQFADLLTLGASGVTLNYDGLSGGDYRVVSYNTSLLATGAYTSLDVSLAKTSAGTLTGELTDTGNVITDIDPGNGQDNAPAGTLVTSVTDATGNVITVPSGGIDVQGQFGVLHINQDGSYTYTLTNTSASVYGRSESFTYTLSHDGDQSSAKLVVTLGEAPAPGSVTAADDSASLIFNTQVSATDNGPSDQTGFTLASVGLGNLLDVSLVEGLTDPIIFNVEEGETRTITVQASVLGVTLGGFDLYIYRFNDAIQQYEQYRVEPRWVTALLGGGSTPLTITLPGGDYLFLLNSSGGLALATFYNLDIQADHSYAVSSLAGTTQGDILANDSAPAGTVVTAVNGVAIAATGTTEIEGQYGTLTIDAAGNYSYTLRSGIGADSIKTPDSFVYTVTAPNGDTSSASLNITATPQPLDAVNDTSSLMPVTTLQDTSQSFTDNSVGNASWAAKLLSATSGSGSGIIEVAAGTAVHNAVLHFNVSSLLSLGGLTVNWTLLDSNGAQVTAGSFNGGLLLGGNLDIPLTGIDLHAGNYLLRYEGNVGALGVGQITVTPSLRGTLVDLDNFETSGSNSVTGNIYDDDHIASVHTLLTVTGAGGSSATLDPQSGSEATATINGKYGVLTMELDGNYTYQLNSGVSLANITSKETFTYTLNDQNGHSDSATLTIEMNPQVVSTAEADRVIGSAYGDTLIYELLNTTDATGGNGATDSWSNFSLAQGDKIDIGDLLVGWNGDNATLGNYLSVTSNGNNTVIAIDRDGSGATFNSTNLVTLENVTTTLDELIQQNHIVT